MQQRREATILKMLQLDVATKGYLGNQTQVYQLSLGQSLGPSVGHGEIKGRPMMYHVC